MPVIRCSTTLSILGFAPLLITVRALAWVTVRTVAALSQGTPNMALSPPMPTKISKSKWNPEPLTIFLSGLLMIRLLKDRKEKLKPTNTAVFGVKDLECNEITFSKICHVTTTTLNIFCSDRMQQTTQNRFGFFRIESLKYFLPVTTSITVAWC